MKRTVLGTILATMLAGGAVAGHHSYGGYEAKLVTLRGVVVEFHLVNPHSLILFETGEGHVYTAEWGAVSALARWGIPPRGPVPGDRMIVTGRMRIDPEGRWLLLREIERPADGWRWPETAR
jgi:hypothetical protein